MGWARAKALVATNSGQRDGWRLNLDGEHVGDLIAPLYVEMFWVSYELIPASDQAEGLLRLDATWKKLRFWSKAMKEYAEGSPFPGGAGMAPTQPRFSMRGLYLIPRSPWERLLCRISGLLSSGFELPLDEDYIESLELRWERTRAAKLPDTELDSNKFAGHIEEQRQKTKLYLEDWAKRRN